MATKIIKAWINGAIQEIEVEDVVSPSQPLSIEDRLVELEDKPVVADGNLLVGNGTTELEEMTPEEILSHINGASISHMTTEEYEAMSSDETNANILYMLTDAKEEIDLDESIISGTLDISNGGTGYTSIQDTNYIAPRYRASSLHSSEVVPDVNGVICWTYE